jgi:DNA-binding NtrC family response regulator
MSRPQILIIDDDKVFAKKLADALGGLFQIELCHSEVEFKERFAVGCYDLLMIDMRLKSDREGLTLLKESLARDPLQAAVVMTAYADTETYADALGSGALTYLDKQAFSPALIARTVEALVAQGVLRRRLAVAERQLAVSEHQEMIGFSDSIKIVGEQLRQAAEDGDIPVLILGEMGSGRQLAARTLHRWNRRRAEGPFVIASCKRAVASKPAKTLFGGIQSLKDEGVRVSKGLIDDAKGGVLYLDELGELDVKEISAVTELIQTRLFKRNGGTHWLEADTQIVVVHRSNTTPIPDKIRRALAMRGCIEIQIPALCERREDIPLIAQYTLQQAYRFGRTQVRSFRGAALVALESHMWPGNVRELRSAIEYAAIRADADTVSEIRPEHLPMGTVDGLLMSTKVHSALNYQVNLARAELGLVESAIKLFEITKKSWLAERLGYNDRFAFSRRLVKALMCHPQLRKDFPLTAALFENEKSDRSFRKGE